MLAEIRRMHRRDGLSLREITRNTGLSRNTIRRRPPKGGAYYSCLGRGAHMFGENSEELKTICQELGDIPLVGFFANGEISNNRLYGFTGVLTLFS